MAIKITAPTSFDITQGRTGVQELHFNSGESEKGEWNEFWFFENPTRAEKDSFSLWFSGDGWYSFKPDRTLLLKVGTDGSVSEIDQGVYTDNFWTANTETASSPDGQYMVTTSWSSTDDALDTQSAELLYSQDYGETWNRLTEAPLGPVFREKQGYWWNKHVLWNGTEFYLMIANGIVNPGQITGEIYTSPNGKDWTLKATLVYHEPMYNDSKLEYCNGIYYLLSGVTWYDSINDYNTGWWWSKDGINYQPLYDRGFQYDNDLSTSCWTVYDPINQRAGIFDVDGTDYVYLHTQEDNFVDRTTTRLFDIFDSFARPFYWKGRIWVYGVEAFPGTDYGWWYSEDTGQTWTLMPGSGANFGYPWDNTATNFHGWDQVIVGATIYFHFDRKIYKSTDMQTWTYHADLPADYDFVDYLGHRPVTGPRKNIEVTGCEGCVVTWTTDETLYNDYLPEGVTEHTDEYPHVAMMGYPYYKKLEYTSEGTDPKTFSIVIGELPPGLTFDGTTLEITGTPTVGCFTDDGNIPFNQWFENDETWRESEPRWYDIQVVADCDETPKLFRIPVYPDWTPYKNSLSRSVEYFEKDVVIKKYGEIIDATTIVREGLCEPCEDEVVETKKTVLNTVRTDNKYQHNDMMDKFMTESTCTPYELTEKTVGFEIEEDEVIQQKEEVTQDIDTTGLCDPCEDN